MVCFYCKRAFTPARPETTDHMIPTSRGGSNRAENRVPCCGPCNWEKADLTHIEYIRFKGLLGTGLSPAKAWSIAKDDASAPRNANRRRAAVLVKEAAE